jgi:hypothetical protein
MKKHVIKFENQLCRAKSAKELYRIWGRIINNNGNGNYEIDRYDEFDLRITFDMCKKKLNIPIPT